MKKVCYFFLIIFNLTIIALDWLSKNGENNLTKEKAIDLLSDKSLNIDKVRDIYNDFKYDKDIVGQVAMNLSLKTSVHNIELGKSKTMVQLLIELADSNDMGSRWAVAKNPHTPVEVLERLSKDKVNLVRALVATNPKTPSRILESLFSDEKIVRDGLSGNPSTPLNLLKVLSDDKDKMVRMRLAENPSATEDILNKLLKDSDKNISKASEVNLKQKRTIENS